MFILVEMDYTLFFFISKSIFKLSLELVSGNFKIVPNTRIPLYKQVEFFHLVKEYIENAA